MCGRQSPWAVRTGGTGVRFRPLYLEESSGFPGPVDGNLVNQAVVEGRVGAAEQRTSEEGKLKYWSRGCGVG